MASDNLLRSIVTLRASVPDDAFTASSLGTSREGSGVVGRRQSSGLFGHEITLDRHVRGHDRQA